MIVATGLTKQFGQFTAVDRVSFTAYPGEILGLLGENGAGKTTTMRMLATLLVPTAGTATVNGKDVREEPEAVRAQLGVLFEGGVYDRLTARENMRYFGRLYGVPPLELERRIDELLRRFHMEEYADRRAGRLSRGMKQKVALARILVHDPSVFILDEPTSGLDVTSARLVHEFILSCKGQGKTVIVSSHNMDEIEKLCDRICVIHRGRVVLEGTISELREQARPGKLEDLLLQWVGDSQ